MRWLHLQLDFDSTLFDGRSIVCRTTSRGHGDVTRPQGASEATVRDGDEDPQEDPLAVHCFCVCSGSALLGVVLSGFDFRMGVTVG